MSVGLKTTAVPIGDEFESEEKRSFLIEILLREAQAGICLTISGRGAMTVSGRGPGPVSSVGSTALADACGELAAVLLASSWASISGAPSGCGIRAAPLVAHLRRKAANSVLIEQVPQ